MRFFEDPADPTGVTAVGRGGIGLWVWHPHTETLEWDRTSARLFEADDEHETPLETWLRRVHPHDRDLVRDAYERGDVAELHYRVVLDDGMVRHLLSRVTHVAQDTDGTVTRIAGVSVDVTSTMRLGNHLVRILDAISDGFISLDRDYRTTYVNRRALELLGMPSSALVGIDLFDAFPKARDTEFEHAYHDVMENRHSRSFVAFYPEPLNMWIEVRAHPVDDGIVILFQDVTDRVLHEQEREALLRTEQQARREADGALRIAETDRRVLAERASHDPLTGLANRAELDRAASDLLADPGADPILAFFDLDHFKSVNDSHGHSVGDAVLVEVSRRLREGLRGSDVAARLGGDEFVVLLAGLGGEGAEAVARRLMTAIREPMLIEDLPLQITTSVGLAAAGPTTTVTSWLDQADLALYRAKAAGRDRLAWFDAAVNEEMLTRQELAQDLRSAIPRGLDLHYQPRFSLQTGRAVGLEALSRWHHPERGQVSPEVFIRLAEETGLIRQLGLATVRTALEHADGWRSSPDLVVWVNVSAHELDRPGYARQVLALLEEHDIPADRFGLEVTEAVLTDEATASHELGLLTAQGVPVAIDHFGTGISSLSRLVALPASVLKIDRSFVAAIHTPRGRGAVETVVKLGQLLGMATVAEGVETVEQLRTVRRMGVTQVSGHLLAAPVPADAIDLESVPDVLA